MKKDLQTQIQILKVVKIPYKVLKKNPNQRIV